jgi:cytoskeletal protein CcmA (bactofilin family)
MLYGMDVAPRVGHRKKSLFSMARGYYCAVSLQALKLNTHGGRIMGLWKKNSNSKHGATSVIDHGCEAQGRLNFVGTVAMNGKFRGELFSADTLLLGAEGEVEAEVQVAVGVISGQIKGNITGRERIELSGTARVFGNIVTPVLVLEEGAVFDGQCKTDRREAANHD